MPGNASNNKRIVKNTMFLYVRMLISVAVHLYTSRVILDALGASDYGLYNVVGGMVTMFAFMSNTMSTAAQRFMSYAIGRNDENDLRNTFVVSNILLWGIALIVLVLVETIGIWLLFNQLNIPDGRMNAAFWVFQFSVGSLFVTIISVPYNAAIIAHERMSAFAYISLIDVFLILAVALLLTFMTGNADRLIVYGGLLMSISILCRLLYSIYCKRHFVECSNNKYKYDKEKGYKMLSFFGWNTIGSLSYVAKEQGVSILINIFFGTVVNAARGVTSQVTGAVQGFISNFQLAMNPQITKYYAQRDYDNLFKLVQRGSKFTMFLYFFLALPLYLNIDYILKLWLVEVPEYTASFIRLTFILMMIDALSSPIVTCLLAVGKVKWYQIVVGGLLILNLPISYMAFHLGCSPETAIQIAIIISSVSLIVRLVMLFKYIKFPIQEFFIQVLLRAISVVVFSFIVSTLIYNNTPYLGFTKLLLTGIASWIITAIIILYAGLNKPERNLIYKVVRNLKNKIGLKK